MKNHISPPNGTHDGVRPMMDTSLPNKQNLSVPSNDGNMVKTTNDKKINWWSPQCFPLLDHGWVSILSDGHNFNFIRWVHIGFQRWVGKPCFTSSRWIQCDFIIDGAHCDWFVRWANIVLGVGPTLLQSLGYNEYHNIFIYHWTVIVHQVPKVGTYSSNKWGNFKSARGKSFYSFLLFDW